MSGLVVVLLVVFWGIVPIFVAHHIGSEKNRAGWAWGFFLGWFGVLIVAVLPPSPEHERATANQRSAMYRECPHCKEQMRRDATTCPHCRGISPAAAPLVEDEPKVWANPLHTVTAAVDSRRFPLAMSRLTDELHAAMTNEDGERVQHARQLALKIADTRFVNSRIVDEATGLASSAQAWLDGWEPPPVPSNEPAAIQLPPEVQPVAPSTESDITPRGASALDIVRERYARGEISREDYHVMLADLA